MRRMSLKLRLTLWYTILMSIISAAALFAITSYSRNMVEQDAGERIVQAVDGMAFRMSLFSEDKPENMPDGFPGNGRRQDMPVMMRPKMYENGVHMVVLDSEKNVIEGQIPFAITDEMEISDKSLRKERYDGNLYLVYDRKTDLSDGRIAYIKGFVSINEESYALGTVLKNNLLLTILLIIIAAIGGYFITGKALYPVNIMSGTAKSIIENNDLSRRINLSGAKDEIGDLANTLDEMLDRIEDTLNREKQFTSDASHELRTPVSVILAECEFMTDCAETAEELKDSAASIKEEAQRMSKLISELLTISRMDSMAIKPVFEETDLSELLDYIVDEQHELHTENVTLKKNIEPNITASVDRLLMSRLFINLISNAYKYNKDGGEITVSLSASDDNVIFSVSDTGIGIEKENQSKIWERFYQVNPARTSGLSESAGLGLSMVKWIAEKHGGTITLESEFGKGSTFTFILPNKAQNGGI